MCLYHFLQEKSVGCNKKMAKARIDAFAILNSDASLVKGCYGFCQKSFSGYTPSSTSFLILATVSGRSSG